MYPTKLYQLLSSFSREELRSFRLFLKSSFFNQSPVLLRLFDVIKKYHPTYTSSRLAKENIYKKLNPSVPFTEKLINDRISELSKLVIEFMTIQQLREDKALKNEVFRKSLASHQLSVMFLSLIHI